MAHGDVRVELPSTGLEPQQTELEISILSNVRRYAEKVLRPVGMQLDAMQNPNDVIKSGSPLWTVYSEWEKLGLSVDAMMELPGDERGRLLSAVFEELGYGDAGLAISLAHSAMPWIAMHIMQNKTLLERYPQHVVGCWGITEPDHGSDSLDFGRVTAHPNTAYGRPNCVVRIERNELVINGQKSAWVSNGPIAQLCVLYAALEDGSGEFKQCTVIVPLDRPGVTRGRVLDKLGQRALTQGEIFFDNVRLSLDHMLAAPGAAYNQAIYGVLAEANVIVGSILTGLARAAYEHTYEYVHTREQGGVPIIRHQMVRYRLFHMFRKLEMARAICRRVSLYNHTAALPAIQGSIAAKVGATQLAFEVASEAIQMFGGNGVTREYPLEKLLRDARSGMIEDGCNEFLALKGGTVLADPSRY